MFLEEFYDYKNRLIGDLLTDAEIVHLINPAIELSDAKSLVHTQVYPYEYIPDTVENANTFVCCDVDIQKSINKMLLIPVMYVWVFSHKSLLKLPEGGLRVDRLVSDIAKKVNGSKFYGLGEIELTAVRRFAPVTDYNGKVMTFQTKEFNHPAPDMRPIPSNRKRS